MTFLNYWLYLLSLTFLVSCQEYNLKFLKNSEPKFPTDGLGEFKIVESIGSVTSAYGGAIKLHDGRVLILGLAVLSSPLKLEVKIFNPISNKTEMTGEYPFQDMIDPEMVLLRNGKVLAVGGTSAGSYSNKAALFHPETNSWEVLPDMSEVRYLPIMVSLSDGRALVIGGQITNSTLTSSAEFFDPLTKTWTPTTNCPFPNFAAPATELNDKRIFISAGNISKAYFFDPELETWTETANLSSMRILHTQQLLPDGRVLVLGGSINASGVIADADIFDPNTETWTSLPPMAFPRTDFGMTFLDSNRLLICGGMLSGSTPVEECEVLNLTTMTWSASFPSSLSKGYMRLVPLNDGRIFATGGLRGGGLITSYSFMNPLNFSVTEPPFLGEKNGGKTIHLDSKRILFAGGSSLTSAIYHLDTKSWEVVGSTQTTRFNAHMYKLPNGKVLLTGGDPYGIFINDLLSSEIFDPITKTWSSSSSLNEAKPYSSSFMLPDGRIVIVGGGDTTTEVFDPITETWSYGSSLISPSSFSSVGHAPNGDVYLFGASVQRYDVVNDLWSEVTAMLTPRLFSQSVLLSDGRFLIIGGFDSGMPLTSTEIFDPNNGTLSVGPSMATPRMRFSLNVFTDGKIIVTGGDSDFSAGIKTNTVEVFNPETGMWSDFSMNLSSARSGHTAVLTEDGLLIWDN